MLSFIILYTISSWALVEFEIEGEKVYFSDEETQVESASTSPMAPRGSALLTHAGELKNSGIEGIIHAASGSMGLATQAFKPSLLGVTLSLKNSLIIAEKKGAKCVAIPFIGAGIFLGSIGGTKKDLAQALMNEAKAFKGLVQKVFVAYDKADYDLFLSLAPKESESKIKVVQGSITDYKTHQCSLIVNAANTELQFGGGVSGVIGQASKKSQEINKLAQAFLNKWRCTWKKNRPASCPK